MKNKKANHTGKIIVGLIILGIVLIVWFNPIEETSIEKDDLSKDEIKIEDTIKIEKNILLPDSENYSTCGELVPENMTLSYDGLSGLRFGSKSLLKNNEKLYSYGIGKTIYGEIIYGSASSLANCKYNSEVGEKATDFRCLGKYLVKSERVSDGIIQEQKDYHIHFDILFSDEKCLTDDMPFVTCEVIDYSCNVKKCVIDRFGVCK